MPRAATGIAALLAALAALLGAGQLATTRPAVLPLQIVNPVGMAASVASTPVPARTPLPECIGEYRAPAWFAPLSFVDPLHGWVHGWICAAGKSQSWLATTVDGGDTWQDLPSPAVLRAPEQSHKLQFISPRDGWLLGPHPTFVTHDGGLTWVTDPALDDVVILKAVGDSIWAVRGHCQTSWQCDYEMLESNDRGATWRSMPNQPWLRGGRVLPTTPGYQLQVVRTGPQAAWILSGGDNAPWMRSAGNTKPPLLLFVTRDAGRHWREVAAPCGEFTNYLAVAGTDSIWLLCNRMPGGNSSLKWLYRSSDGGSTWALVGDAVLPDEPGLQNLGIGGWVDGLVVVSPEHAFMAKYAVGISALLVTRDGGQDWAAVPPFGVGDSIRQVVFADEQHGWIVTQDALWRTKDGGDTWERLAP